MRLPIFHLLNRGKETETTIDSGIALVSSRPGCIPFSGKHFYPSTSTEKTSATLDFLTHFLDSSSENALTRGAQYNRLAVRVAAALRPLSRISVTNRTTSTHVNENDGQSPAIHTSDSSVHGGRKEAPSISIWYHLHLETRRGGPTCSM